MKSLHFFLILLISCSKPAETNSHILSDQQIDSIYVAQKFHSIIDSSGHTIATRFNPPKGFIRRKEKSGSFGEYLQQLPLQSIGSPVKKYNGEIMSYESKHVADGIIDLDVGDKDLQQCADAVIRLRAEFYYAKKEYDNITFALTNGFKMDYYKWMQGYRLKVKGNKTWWVKTSEPSNSYESFRNYLDHVFMYAGTISMVKETQPVSIDDIQIGDVFVISDAHAVIVVDLSKNLTTGEKLMVLAQSYMPARSIHVLKNPNTSELSPWYTTSFGQELNTPQWTFNARDLRRYPLN